MVGRRIKCGEYFCTKTALLVTKPHVLVSPFLSLAFITSIKEISITKCQLPLQVQKIYYAKLFKLIPTLVTIK